MTKDISFYPIVMNNSRAGKIKKEIDGKNSGREKC
jgi:hypothetical protein